VCWITVTRLPLAVFIDHLTPIPGSLVSFSSSVIASLSV
jgi:hypothetical protein